MAKLSPAEKVRLERLLEMEGGYVLDFGNDSMARFFADSVGIDIEDRQRYGDVSKARRMRAFWSLETDAVVGKLLRDMIDYRSARGLGSDDDAALVEQCQATAARLLASGGVEISSAPPLDSLSHEFIDEQIEKCKGKLARGDTGGAITNARTLVEVVLIALERELYGGTADHKGELTTLYKRVAKRLKLEAGRPELSTPLKQILSGLNGTVTGLGALRSKASDAHGRLYRTHAHHARLAVNAAMTLTDFLLSTYEYQGRPGPFEEP